MGSAPLRWGGAAQHGQRGGHGVRRGSLPGWAGVSPGELWPRGGARLGAGGDLGGGTGWAACVGRLCPGPRWRCGKPAQAARIRGTRVALRDLAGISGSRPRGKQLSPARHGTASPCPTAGLWLPHGPWGWGGVSTPLGTPAARARARRGSLGRGGGCRRVSPAGDGGAGRVPAPGGLRGGFTPRRGGAAGARHRGAAR